MRYALMFALGAFDATTRVRGRGIPPTTSPSLDSRELGERGYRLGASIAMIRYPKAQERKILQTSPWAATGQTSP
jgi:hypothetical protein